MVWRRAHSHMIGRGVNSGDVNHDETVEACAQPHDRQHERELILLARRLPHHHAQVRAHESVIVLQPVLEQRKSIEQ